MSKADALADLAKFAIKYGPAIASTVSEVIDAFKSERATLQAHDPPEDAQERIKTAVELMKEAKFREDA